jgi:16S rRNA (guanine966-N2)-methyltransferase
MRIIAGKLRRRTLSSPKGHLTRPTSDRTREAIFNLVESRMDIDGSDMLDLFCGTGALGLEALSRGAIAATFVETDGAVLKFARKNAESLGVDDQCQFIRADAIAFMERYRGPGFDLVIADPPYEQPGLIKLPALTLPHLAEGGLFVLEHDVRHSFDEHPHLQTSRSYGRTIVSVFTAEPQTD